MKKIILSADSTLDMPPALLEQYDVRVIASYVTLGEKTVDDWPDLTPKDLFDYVARTGQLAQTSAANPTDYIGWFERLTAEGGTVIHFAKSAAISSCYENACIAAKEVGNVYVVDTKSLAGGSSMQVLAAARSGETDPEKLVALVENVRDRIDGSFIIETLEFLRKGGRCSTLAALGANILKLRPEIVFDNGAMRVGKKYRGVYSKCVYAYLDDRLAKLDDYDLDLVFISHTIQDPAFLAELKNYVQTKTGCKTLLEYPASSAISTHCGPNTFGVFFLKKA